MLADLNLKKKKNTYLLQKVPPQKNKFAKSQVYSMNKSDQQIRIANCTQTNEGY